MTQKQEESGAPASAAAWDELFALDAALAGLGGLSRSHLRPPFQETAPSLPTGLFIAPELLAERDLSDKRLVQGMINLKDALLISLNLGVPVSRLVVDLCEAAFDDYQDSNCSDLAIKFGCDLTQRERKSETHQTARSNVKFHVQSFADQGCPLHNPNNHPDKVSAFTKTAELLKNLTASSVFEIYYDRDVRKKKNYK